MKHRNKGEHEKNWGLEIKRRMLDIGIRTTDIHREMVLGGSRIGYSQICANISESRCDEHVRAQIEKTVDKLDGIKVSI